MDIGNFFPVELGMITDKALGRVAMVSSRKAKNNERQTPELLKVNWSIREQ